MYTVDRIEEKNAILENKETGKIIEIDINILPNKVKEGDILEFKNNNYILNDKITKQNKKHIKNRFNKLKKIEE